jgi:hypothetical protein
MSVNENLVMVAYGVMSRNPYIIDAARPVSGSMHVIWLVPHGNIQRDSARRGGENATQSDQGRNQ